MKGTKQHYNYKNKHYKYERAQQECIVGPCGFSDHNLLILHKAIGFSCTSHDKFRKLHQIINY